MRNIVSKEIFNNLETIWQTDEDGIEFVYARDLQKILGYNNWREFETTIKKAMISCESNGNPSVDHFGDAPKMVNIGSNTKREVQDYKLTRYACYLTAQNGDPRKEEIAFAQNYFAVQTRKFELVEQRVNDYKRVLERNELRGEEKIFSEELYQRGVDHQGFARIRSKGDEALFGGNTTKDMTRKSHGDYVKDYCEAT
jgi:DNA-damage-inducible protein D